MTSGAGVHTPMSYEAVYDYILVSGAPQALSLQVTCRTLPCSTLHPASSHWKTRYSHSPMDSQAQYTAFWHRGDSVLSTNCICRKLKPHYHFSICSGIPRRTEYIRFVTDKDHTDSTNSRHTLGNKHFSFSELSDDLFRCVPFSGHWPASFCRFFSLDLT